MSDWRYHKITRETAEIYEVPGREVTYFLATAGVGVPRCFWATSDDARMIIINAPGGPAEGFIRYMQTLTERPDEAVFKRCKEEFGVTFGRGDEKEEQ
ncbi:MAG: hypothetical protein E2O52_06655 [Gammaproteobacteria bacterium]|nr:MAG: hypothetical protein E2O52_06655 [Gammaproteobacteria bacterium]